MLYTEMNFPTEILRAVSEMGFSELTEVQEKAIPPMLEGKDVVAKAPTGTGKTCAFGIPLLMGLDTASNRLQSLILAPTRELARQIADDLQDLSRYLPGVRLACVYGGQPLNKQFPQLKKNPHLLVATPGRLFDHMKRNTVSLREVTRIVLDEADEMLDMGFYKDVIRILDAAGKREQMGMFSATISRPVMDISWLYQRDPVEIEVRPVADSMPKITQYSLPTTGLRKLADVVDIVEQNGYERVMVFCNTKYTSAMLAGQLAGQNVNVACLHGDLSQSERNRAMNLFRDGNLRVLVSTDVAARGIDVDDVEAVINYDVPTSNEYYIHRIGRTGRAKKQGVSYILYLPEEEKRLRDMLRLTRSDVTPVHFDENRKLIPDSAEL